MNNTLVICLVLYEMPVSKIPSYRILNEYLKNEDHVHLFIYDNSKQKQDEVIFNKKNVTYIHDETNPGLATAYNAGKEFLLKIDGDILLLLDQDTLLNEAYLKEAQQKKITKNIGAYVPIIHSSGRQISPVSNEKYINRGSIFPNSGKHMSIMAINSGTLIPKHSLIEIKNFNLEFPLDFLDHWFFWTMENNHKEIEVLDYVLTHDLSVLDYNGVSSIRYESILTSETLFFQKYDRNKLSAYKNHLLLRTMKQFIKVRNRRIWRRTFKEYIALMKGK